MTPSEDLWAEVTPLRSGKATTIIDIAQGPAEADELHGEHEIVAAMRAATLGVAPLEPGRKRLPGYVGRVVAVKGVAAVGVIALGVATAAAATGIAASMLLPSADDDPTPGQPAPTTVTHGDAPDEEPAEQEPEDLPTVGCEAGAPCPQEPGQQSPGPTTGPDEAPAPDAANAEGEGEGNAETPTPPTGDTGTGEDPARGHGPPADPGQRGQGDAPPGREPGSPPGPPGEHPLPPPEARPPVGPPHPAPPAPPGPPGRPNPASPTARPVTRRTPGAICIVWASRAPCPMIGGPTKPPRTTTVIRGAPADATTGATDSRP